MALGKVGGNQLETTLNIDSGTLYVDGTNNRVGVNTITPSSTLNVNSGAANTNTIFESTDATVLNLYKDSGGSAQISSSSGDLKFATGGDTAFSGLANRLLIDSSGRVTMPYQPMFHANFFATGQHSTTAQKF